MSAEGGTGGETPARTTRWWWRSHSTSDDTYSRRYRPPGTLAQQPALPLQDFRWFWTVAVICAIGIGSTLIYIMQVPSGVRWSVFGTALTIAAAAFLTGGIFGFLFGIPQTMQASAQSISKRQYQDNTNLQLVSDWLTKIIIGVGLVQLGRALPALSKLAENLKAPLGGQASSAAFGLGLTIAYVLLGFFFVYLWSRVVFTQELNLQDTMQVLAERDADRLNALRLVSRQLTLLKGGERPPQDELNTAIASVDDATRLEIFNQANSVRKAWRDPKAKQSIELTIPVFQALIAAEGNKQLHRNHGTLAWALKDKKIPDWPEAIAELTTAITIRDKSKVVGWKLYEANRAFCRIKLFYELPAGDPRRELLQKQIEEDLKEALREPYARERMVDKNEDIQRWLHRHRYRALGHLRAARALRVERNTRRPR
jgi:hypothetical protein